MTASERSRAGWFAAGFAAVLLLRIAFLARLSDNYDFESFRIVAGAVGAGRDFYSATARYNYSPLWAYVLGAAAQTAQALGVSLARVVTSLLLISDVASAWVVYRILRARNVSSERAGLGALLFFASPVSILTSSVRGAFDGLAILCLLVAVAAAMSRPTRRGLAVAAMAVSLLVKHVAWFHPLLFVRAGRAKAKASGPAKVSGLAAAALPYVVFVLSFAPFWRSWPRIRSQVFGYRGLDEPYGTEWLRIAGILPAGALVALSVVVSVGAALWLALREEDFSRSSRILFLVLLLVLPGVTPYYFVWPIALGALEPNLGYGVYTVIVTLFFIHSPDGLGLELAHLPGWSGVWWATAFWLLWELRLRTRRVSSARRAAGQIPHCAEATGK